MNTEAISPDAELAIVDALLAGSDEPVEVDMDEDLSTPAIPPHAVIKADDVSDEVDDVIELLDAPSPAPRAEKKERKDRVTAFADRIAEERSRAMLGDALDPIITGMGEAPKKVAEKVYNVLCHVADRGKLSAYTSIGLQALREHPEALTGPMMVEYFKAAGYSEATARSQGHQQMTTLPILGLATKADHTLTAAPECPVWALLDAKDAPPAIVPAEELLADAVGVKDAPDVIEDEAEEPAPVQDGDDEELLAGED